MFQFGIAGVFHLDSDFCACTATDLEVNWPMSSIRLSAQVQIIGVASGIRHTEKQKLCCALVSQFAPVIIEETAEAVVLNKPLELPANGIYSNSHVFSTTPRRFCSDVVLEMTSNLNSMRR